MQLLVPFRGFSCRQYYCVGLRAQISKIENCAKVITFPRKISSVASFAAKIFKDLSVQVQVWASLNESLHFIQAGRCIKH